MNEDKKFKEKPVVDEAFRHLINVDLPREYLDSLFNLFSRWDLISDYSKTLRYVGNVMFEIVNPLDANRIGDVKKLREIYRGDLSMYPATVLEVLMGLCMRFGDEIGCNWEDIFWKGLENAGILDEKFKNNELWRFCEDNVKIILAGIIVEILWRNCEDSVKIFPTSGKYGDFTEKDLWQNLMIWYSETQF